MNRMPIALALSLLALSLQAAEPAKQKSGLTVPPIQYKHRTLGNGLEVYSIQDRSTPTVAIQVWYRVGSKDDPQGRSGFAHLFEHIMFKSTKNMPAEMLDRLTEDVGGFNNATTYEDSTPYYEVVPSNYLETLLWAEAERMGSLNVDEPTFRSERDVVKEEFRFRILAPPYGRLYYAIEQNSFTEHPYRRPGIGSIEDLDAATLDDVRAFHSTYYRPDNAVLIVAGDFEQAQLDEWVDKYFAPIPKPSAAIPRVNVKEPARTKERRLTIDAPNAPLPAIALNWLAPPAGSEDAAALTVASALLSKGESSRLYQAMIYKNEMAVEVEAGTDLRQDLGLFVMLAIMATGRTAAEGEKALMAELEKLQKTPVSAAELEKAKNLLITDVLRERETAHGKAFALGQAIVLTGRPAEVNRVVSRLQGVTAADVQRVLRKYAGQSKPVVIAYQAPAEEKKEATQ